MSNSKHNRGFIALIGAVIISMILLELSIAAGESTFSARIGSLNLEMKAVSKTAAEACIAHAMLLIVENYNYTPHPDGDAITFGDAHCTIVSVTYEPENTVIHNKTGLIITRGNSYNSWTTLQTKVLIRNPSFPHSPDTIQIKKISVEEI